ncbi:DUF6880 family protein [Dyella sp. KRB-257]|uniref:DUF6880 family protein n=1 Tax=Dyella sp. KRB-257 TaxID=3400915 RepID=UPI003C112411
MLDDLISRASLEGLAGPRAFRCGEEYLAVGAVGRLRITGDSVAAKVEGTTTYRVELRDDDGALAFDCSCPHAADGYFCKHGVALGLAWLDRPEAERKADAASGRKRRRDPWRDIEQYLSAQPADTLIELLLDVARRDDRLYQSLLLKAERAGGGRGNVARAFRRAIDEATRIHGFVDWREAGTFAGDMQQVAESIAELLRPDTAALLVELTEYAVERLEKSMEQVDDSDGEVGNIVHGLGELHLQACLMAMPDPAALAERLFALETTLPFGVWSFDALTYRNVLGAAGLQRYREVAQTAWRKLKPRDAQDAFDSSRFTITRIMERLAEASGNIEELVAIKSKDLSCGYRYLEIAEIWAKAKQPDKALEWAERGLQAFPERPDNRLRDFLVACYLKRKRNDEALQLTWIQFEEQPALGNYQKLHEVARKLRCWPAQRERALAWVAAAALRGSSHSSHWPRAATPDYSLRMEIALWENDLDAAWQAAQSGPCNRNLLIVLAGKLEPTRPDDAISLYRLVIPPIVEQTNNAAYAEAIILIRRMGGLMKAQRQSAPFGDYLAELRVRYKPKRNFIKLLDGVIRSSGS